MARLRLSGVVAILALVSQASALGSKRSGENGRRETNPIAKVVELMKKLTSETKARGKKEAKSYDKFACYCREQAIETQDAIEHSVKKIKKLTSKIAKLTSDIQELHGAKEDGLTGKIFKLNEIMIAKTTEIATKTAARKATNDAYKLTASEIADANTAIEGAIAAIKGKKATVKDSGNMALLQDQLLDVLSKHTPTESQLSLVEALSEADISSEAETAIASETSEAKAMFAPPTAPKPHAYQYKSGGILTLLDNLSKEFRAKKVTANDEERKSLVSFDGAKQALENEFRYTKEEKVEKQRDLAGLQADRTKATSDKAAEDADKTSDDGFMKELTSNCEDKAVAWDARSKTRSLELTALSQALEQLTKKGGVSDNFGATSFLQLGRGTRDADSDTAIVSQAMALVSSEAERINSATLRGFSVQMSLTRGFGAVMKLIDDLIAKQVAIGKAAGARKGKCDIDMKNAVGKRDKNKLASDDASGTIALKAAEIKGLKDEVSVLQKAILKLKKAVLEASELRAAEKADNVKSIADSIQGKAAVDSAISSLKAFYSGSFVQTQSIDEAADEIHYEGSFGADADADADADAAPAKNRAGKTIADGNGGKADFTKSAYKKNKGGTGVIGILETIQSDFQNTIDSTGTAETDGVTTFTAFKTDADANMAGKAALVTKKKGEITAAKGATTDAKQALSDADKAFELAVKELEQVSAMCLTGTESASAAKLQREAEIKSLESAKGLLANFNKKKAR